MVWVNEVYRTDEVGVPGTGVKVLGSTAVGVGGGGVPRSTVLRSASIVISRSTVLLSMSSGWSGFHDHEGDVCCRALR